MSKEVVSTQIVATDCGNVSSVKVLSVTGYRQANSLLPVTAPANSNSSINFVLYVASD